MAISGGGVPKYAKRAFLGTLIYGGIAIGLVFVFFLLHYLGNQLPQERGFKTVSEAFERHNMIAHDYPLRAYGTRSVQSLIGQDQFTDCEIFGGVLAPSSTLIEDSIILKGINLRTGKGMCSELHGVVSGSEYEIKEMKKRYWWGTKALVSLWLLIGMDIFQINNGIKVFTYFSYLCLCLAAFWHSVRLFVLLCPFIIFGFLFSGISYYGGFSYSLPYLFSIISLVFLVISVKMGTSTRILRMFFLVVGIISSYLYLLDGSLMMFLPISAIILWFGWKTHQTISGRIFIPLYCGSVFFLGFFSSFILNQFVKSWYAQSSVFSGFVNQLYFRLSSNVMRVDKGYESAGHIEAISEAIRKFIRYGVGDVGFWGARDIADLFVFISLFAALLAIAVSTYRKVVRKSSAPLIAVALIGASVAIVFARVAIFPNHSYFHSFFVGRYMFVPAALFWSMLIASFWKPVSFISTESREILRSRKPDDIDSRGADGSRRT